MAILLALLPVLFPLLGALTVLLTRRYPRVKPFVAGTFILLTFIFLVVNTLRANNPGFMVTQQSLVPDIDLRFNYDPVTLLFSSLGLAACLTWLLIENLRP